jgi:hypothetical protein
MFQAMRRPDSFQDPKRWTSTQLEWAGVTGAESRRRAPGMGRPLLLGSVKSGKSKGSRSGLALGGKER